MSAEGRLFLAKATVNVASAESEFAAGRFDSCANRCYYACFQAAVAALDHAGIKAPGKWKHDTLQARFAGELVNRRHLLQPDLRETLSRLATVRQRADYEPDPATQTQAQRALRDARRFVQAIEERTTR